MKCKTGMYAVVLFLGGLVMAGPAFAHGGKTGVDGQFFVHIRAINKIQRTQLANMGVSIESTMSDSVYGTVSPRVMARLRRFNIPVLESFPLSRNIGMEEFPSDDSRFHDYKEMTKALGDLAAAYPNILKMFSIGKSLENRDIWCVQVNSSATRGRIDGRRTFSAKPGAVFMGNHHAREHVSAEIPFMILEFIAKNYGSDPAITRLVDTRDIYFIPMVNPDGAEFDITGGSYHMHRKNTRRNSEGSVGVDLNRNYGFMWGTGGSSKDPSSDVYMGPRPFSEPETQAIKAFVESRPNVKVLLSYHTFSELILYPWGHKYDAIDNQKDRDTYTAMARTMAKWNGYKPEQSSELYIASGDTTDWAYGALGIFAFTFELSPKSMWEGGFYPGQKILDRVFAANLKPALYMMDLADNPYRALNRAPGGRMAMLDDDVLQ
ncbi:MAG: zinc carboxypeptidase [Deltaproteobacteria bacterium]|nr:zinc carboxypeptidase [Deltaproteobacteria bacterium]